LAPPRRRYARSPSASPVPPEPRASGGAEARRVTFAETGRRRPSPASFPCRSSCV